MLAVNHISNKSLTKETHGSAILRHLYLVHLVPRGQIIPLNRYDSPSLPPSQRLPMSRVTSWS